MWGPGLGCHLNTFFGYTAVMPIAVPKKKRSLLPLLTFLFSYGLMTVLIVEQGSAIQSQRNLIQVLMRDSTELWAAKGKAIGDQQMARAQAEAKAGTHAPSPQAQAPTIQTPSSQNPSTQAQSTQAPSTQARSTQAPATKAPSTQAVPQHRSQTQAGKIAKPETQLPPVPASDLVDRRRALATI